jgi:hypothetical protein
MFTIGEVLTKDVDAVKAVLLPPPRPETDVAQLLSHGGVVVVVGGRSSNFSQEHLRNPRIVFWHSTDPKTNSPNRTLPANARAVVFAGFISHAMDNRIRNQAKSRGVFSPPGILSTGDIRELLTKMVTLPERPVNLDPKPLPVPVVAVMPTMPVLAETNEPDIVKRKLKIGELKAFVIAEGNASAKPTIPEAQRLLAILESRGIRSTLISVDQALRTFVVYPARKAKGTPTTAAQARTEFKAAAAVSEGFHGGGYPAPDTLLDQISAVRQTAIDMRAGLDLQLEALTAIEAEVTRLRRAQQQTRQSLREFLD